MSNQGATRRTAGARIRPSVYYSARPDGKCTDPSFPMQPPWTGPLPKKTPLSCPLPPGGIRSDSRAADADRPALVAVVVHGVVVVDVKLCAGGVRVSMKCRCRRRDTRTERKKGGDRSRCNRRAQCERVHLMSPLIRLSPGFSPVDDSRVTHDFGVSVFQMKQLWSEPLAEITPSSGLSVFPARRPRPLAVADEALVVTACVPPHRNHVTPRGSRGSSGRPLALECPTSVRPRGNCHA